MLVNNTVLVYNIQRLTNLIFFLVLFYAEIQLSKAYLRTWREIQKTSSTDKINTGSAPAKTDRLSNKSQIIST